MNVERKRFEPFELESPLSDDSLHTFPLTNEPPQLISSLAKPESISSPELVRENPRLTVIVVNFNTKDLLKNCLDSIFKNSPIFGLKVCVVDNGSSDGSPEMVSADFPEVELTRSPKNLGFSRANNLILSNVETEYALLVNPDILLPPGAIGALISFMDSNPNIGVLGPKLIRPDGSFDPGSKMGFATVENVIARKLGLAKLFPKSRVFGGYHLKFLDENQISDVDAVAGACMVIRKDVLERVGFFDEEFFLGCEDLDFCYRVAQTPGPSGKPYRIITQK